MTAMYEFPCGCRWPVVGPAPREGALPLLDVDDENLPFCPATWELLGRGDTKGVFQLESPLGRQQTKKLKPENGEHIGALGAILRPGCLRAVDENGISMTQHFCRRKNGEEEIQPYHPAIDRILAPTYGCLCYQEQAMQIAQAVAGFDLQEADQLRKAIGKKLPEEMAKCRKLFMEGAAKAGLLTTEQAEEVFGWIEKSQRYSFNKCTWGGEVIRRPNGGRFSKEPFTIAEMYRIRNDLDYAKATGHEQLRRKWNRLGNYGKGLSMCEDGRIRPNTIVDIRFAGRRRVFKLVLTNGKSICVTGNHKFPTNKGTKTVDQMVAYMASDDGKNLKLYVCGEYEPTDFRKYGRFSDMTNEDRRLAIGGSGKGCLGSGNRWYTNGSYTEFKHNAAILPKECDRCGARTGRLELHHKNGNRSNSHESNLVRLCSSCHKKSEYAAGRTKRGEKGYPSVEAGISSITAIEELETYDVTMAAPAHNFVTGQGIVTCNSHAVSYGLTGYDTAYIKAHFPVAYYCSWLRFAKEKQDPMQEVYELVNDARLNDVQVLPPDLRNMEPHFATDGVVVTFGLSDIKGVGVTQISKTKAVVEDIEREIGKPLAEWKWLDFLFFASHRITSSTVERLVSVGALRWLGTGRQRMLTDFNAWSDLTDPERGWVVSRERLGRGLAVPEDLLPPLPAEPSELDEKYRDAPEKTRSRLLKTAKAAWAKKKRERDAAGEALTLVRPFDSLVEAIKAVARTKKEGGGAARSKRVETLKSIARLLEHPPSPVEDTPDLIAWTEDQFLGIALTCSRVDAFDQQDVNTSCKDFVSGKTGYMVFGVQIEQVREIKTKKGRNPGQKMAFLTISDGTCSISDVICFPEAWKEFGGLLKEQNCVLLQGERDVKQGSLLVKKVCQMER